MEYVEYRCKSMLKRKDHVDSWFWTENGCSPYRGCEHQCVYCDGRNSYYGVKDFSNRVYVKVNSEEILKKELEKRFPNQKNLFEFGYETRKPTLYIGSGTSDAFQQAEAKYRLTQRLLKIFLKYGVPLHIMTKSALVLRDLELLKELSDKSWLTISFSFSTSDAKLSRKFEPKTSPPAARFRAIEKLTRKKIRCGVTYIPVLPLLSDSRENLEAVISKAKDSGASYILLGTMTLKEEDRELMFRVLKKDFPEVFPMYKTLYKKGWSPPSEYVNPLMQTSIELCREYKIPYWIERYIPKCRFKKNLEVSTMLLQLSYFSQLEGKDSYSFKSYEKAGNTIENLKIDVEEFYKRGRLREIPYVGIGIEKLISEFLEKGKVSRLEGYKEGFE